MRLREIVNEVMNNALPTKSRWSGRYPVFNKTTKTQDGKTVDITIHIVGNNYALINFYVDERQDLSGTGDALPILSTIIKELRDFVRKRKPNIVAWVANDKEPSRIRLYDRLVDRIHTYPEFSNYIDITDDEEFWPTNLSMELDAIQDMSAGKLYVFEKVKHIIFLK